VRVCRSAACIALHECGQPAACRYYLVRGGFIPPEGEDSSKHRRPGAFAAAVSLLAPFWHFLGYDTYARERQLAAAAAAAAEDAGSAGTAASGAAERLLPEGSGAQADAEAAISKATPSQARSTGAEALLAKLANRIRSIDSLRGTCLAFMIFFNTGGGGYWFMDHSAWNGLTVADLVFPIFVWTQGTVGGVCLRRLMRC
jgi:hypothetical protein